MLDRVIQHFLLTNLILYTFLFPGAAVVHVRPSKTGQLKQTQVILPENSASCVRLRKHLRRFTGPCGAIASRSGILNCDAGQRPGGLKRHK